MLRLLLALLVCGGLAYFLLRGTGENRAGVTATPENAVRTLERNGCASLGGAPAGTMSAANLHQGLQNLQKAIEKCQANSARRAESP